MTTANRAEICDSDEFGTYLFEYRHDGAWWGLEIKARDPLDARARLKALAFAQYRGAVVVKVPVPTPSRFARRVRGALRWLLGGGAKRGNALRAGEAS